MDETSLTFFIQGSKALSILNENFTNPVKRADARLLVEPAKRSAAGFSIALSREYFRA